MPSCPTCQAVVSSQASACFRCGADFSSAPPRAAAPPPAPTPRRSRASRLLALVLIGCALGAALVGAYWWIEIRPRQLAIEGRPLEGRPSRPKRVEIAPGLRAGFDQLVALPSAPHGIAWDGKSFVVAAGEEPWGFLRLEREADSYRLQHVPVLEDRNQQRMQFDAVTWNGEHFVAVASGAWFGSKSGEVFTRHDPATLAIVSTHPAPPMVGALCWDGSGYWAATRSHTPDSTEPAHLYQIDADFQVVRTLPALHRGCQGLAWDGSHLFAVDVFAGGITALDVGGAEPVVLAEHELPFRYPSGVAWDGTHLWLAEYEENRLHRAETAYLVAWMSGTAPEPPPESATTPPPAAPPVDTARVEELLDALWSDDAFVRMGAENELKQMGLPVTRARLTPMGPPETGPADTDLLDLRVETEGGELAASWSVHVGEELFREAPPEATDDVISMPRFARYQVTVSGGTLAQDVETTYEAEPGQNVMEKVVLGRGLGPGQYSVSVFIHVQHVNAEGVGQILNDNAGTVWVDGG